MIGSDHEPRKTTAACTGRLVRLKYCSSPSGRLPHAPFPHHQQHLRTCRGRWRWWWRRRLFHPSSSLHYYSSSSSSSFFRPSSSCLLLLPRHHQRAIITSCLICMRTFVDQLCTMVPLSNAAEKEKEQGSSWTSG